MVNCCPFETMRLVCYGRRRWWSLWSRTVSTTRLKWIFQQLWKNLVCQLHKFLYRLKQAFKNWFDTFLKVIQKARYIQSKVEYSLFTKTVGSSFTTVFLYVDDILLTGNNDVKIRHLKVFLLQHFWIKDLGTINVFWELNFLGLNTVFFVSKKIYVGHFGHYRSNLGKIWEVPHGAKFKTHSY